MSSVRILAAGLNVVDVLVRAPGVVRHGDKHPVEDLVVQGGGPAGNAACVTAGLGIRTAFLARVGSCTLSRLAREELRRCGVSESALIEDAAASPAVSVIEIDPATGERTIFYRMTGYRGLQEGDVTAERFGRPEAVLVDGYDAAGARAVLRRAAGERCASVVDVESGPVEVMRELAALATDAVLPLAAAERCTGCVGPEAAVRALARLSRRDAVVTDGVRGCWAVIGERVHHQRAFPVAVKDTTGCGDCFHGAYAAGLVMGWGMELRLEFAAFIASRAAMSFGGRGFVPTPAWLRGIDAGELSPGLRAVLKDFA